MLPPRRAIAFFIAAVAAAATAIAGEVASGKLDIVGMALEVEPSVTAGVDVARTIQTIFNGKTNGDAPATDMQVAGDLTGPGLDAPLTLFTQPGQKFQLPPLHEQGDYVLQNVRLLDSNGQFVQPAIPPTVSITVVGVLETKVTVRQLTPEDLRARGITWDSRNFDAYVNGFAASGW